MTVETAPRPAAPENRMRRGIRERLWAASELETRRIQRLALSNQLTCTRDRPKDDAVSGNAL